MSNYTIQTSGNSGGITGSIFNEGNLVISGLGPMLQKKRHFLNKIIMMKLFKINSNVYER